MARRRLAVTIKHVAADAGVSLQTVSRVINNEPNVRPEMRERVQASIDRSSAISSSGEPLPRPPSDTSSSHALTPAA